MNPRQGFDEALKKSKLLIRDKPFIWVLAGFLCVTIHAMYFII